MFKRTQSYLYVCNSYNMFTTFITLECLIKQTDTRHDNTYSFLVAPFRTRTKKSMSIRHILYVLYHPAFIHVRNGYGRLRLVLFNHIASLYHESSSF